MNMLPLKMRVDVVVHTPGVWPLAVAMGLCCVASLSAYASGDTLGEWCAALAAVLLALDAGWGALVLRKRARKEPEA